MRATLGESFTMRGRFVSGRTEETRPARSTGSFEKNMPPCFVLGQLTFNS